MHRPPLPRRKYSWYSFLLEAESIQGHRAAGSIVSMKNAIDSTGNRTRNLSAAAQCLNEIFLRVPLLNDVLN